MEVGRGGTKGVGGRSSLPGVEDDGMSGGIEAWVLPELPVLLDRTGEMGLGPGVAISCSTSS